MNDSPTARGTRFDKKAGKAYDYNQVHLANGKRLDSYDPGKAIVSRKATDFDVIEEKTFRAYLRELKQKYPPGTVIRSNKYSDLDGQKLKGKLVLEVPKSNEKALNKDAFEEIAKEEGVTIKYAEE